MPMILKFGLLMESVSSCIFFSQVLSCLIVLQFSFNYHLIFEFWDSVFSLFCSAWLAFHFVLQFCFILFLRFSISWVALSVMFSIFALSSFISLLIVFFVSLWCLYSASMVSFISSCAFSNSLFLLS
jgi:hypothetical protein